MQVFTEFVRRWHFEALGQTISSLLYRRHFVFASEEPLKGLGVEAGQLVRGELVAMAALIRLV